MARAPSAADNVAAKGVAERAKAAQEANAETERRMAESRPTPTQEENDLAKVGALNPDGKADDGGGLDPAVERTAQANAGLGYQTRSTEALAPRGPGRPRRDEA